MQVEANKLKDNIEDEVVKTHFDLMQKKDSCLILKMTAA